MPLPNALLGEKGGEQIYTTKATIAGLCSSPDVLFLFPTLDASRINKSESEREGAGAVIARVPKWAPGDLFRSAERSYHRKEA